MPDDSNLKPIALHYYINGEIAGVGDNGGETQAAANLQWLSKHRIQMHGVKRVPSKHEALIVNLCLLPFVFKNTTINPNAPISKHLNLTSLTT